MSSNGNVTRRPRKNSIITLVTEQQHEFPKDDTESTAYIHDNKVRARRYSDAGTHPPDRYKPHMSSMRYKIREFLLPFVIEETPILSKYQKKFRAKFLDWYFIYSANLGSHTFYVLCLPISRWLGFSKIARDLIFLLGYSIFVSGYFKDFCCLPRPRSPPLQRITHSAYTTKEYGAPSSHTANATAVTLFLLYLFVTDFQEKWNLTQSVLFVSVILVYYFTLTLGRLYSGMHGFLDLESGMIIGAIVCVIRVYIRDFIDASLLTKWWYPVLNIVLGMFLLFTHIRPVDDCPCFKDSVAFIGVLGGMEFSDWLYPYVFNVENYEIPFPNQNRIKLSNFLFSTSSTRGSNVMIWFKLCARIIVGLICVLGWKEGLATVLGSLLGDRIRDAQHEDTIPTSINSDTNESKLREQVKKDEKTGGLETPLYKGLSTNYILWRYFVYAVVPFVAIIIAPLFFKMIDIL